MNACRAAIPSHRGMQLTIMDGTQLVTLSAFAPRRRSDQHLVTAAVHRCRDPPRQRGRRRIPGSCGTAPRPLTTRATSHPRPSRRLTWLPGRSLDGSTSQLSTLVLTQPAPHTVVDTGQYGPLQAQTLHRATGTNPLGLAEPKLCRATLADREEQLRILPLARCILIPAHRTSFPASFELRLVMRRR